MQASPHLVTLSLGCTRRALAGDGSGPDSQTQPLWWPVHSHGGWDDGIPCTCLQSMRGAAFLSPLPSTSSRLREGAGQAALCRDTAAAVLGLWAAGPCQVAPPPRPQSVSAWAADPQLCPTEGEGPEPPAQLQAQRRAAWARGGALLTPSRAPPGPSPYGLASGPAVLRPPGPGPARWRFMPQPRNKDCSCPAVPPVCRKGPAPAAT